MKILFAIWSLALASSELKKCYKEQDRWSKLWSKSISSSTYIRKRKYGPQDHDAISWNKVHILLPPSGEDEHISFKSERTLRKDGEVEEEPLKRTKRILGGLDAYPGMFPHQVSLQVSSSEPPLINIFSLFIRSTKSGYPFNSDLDTQSPHVTLLRCVNNCFKLGHFGGALLPQQ